MPSDIHCLRTPTVETFTAFLRLPSGFDATPVLEEGVEADTQSTCLITETNVQGKIIAYYSNLKKKTQSESKI